MADIKTTRFLAIVQLHTASTIQRVARDAPGIIDMLKAASTGQHEQAFRSNDGQMFGYFIESRLPAHRIRVAFESCPNTMNNDAVLVVEIGRETAEYGFKRPWGWVLKTQGQ